MFELVKVIGSNHAERTGSFFGTEVVLFRQKPRLHKGLTKTSGSIARKVINADFGQAERIMNLKLNGHQNEYPQGLTLGGLLGKLDLDGQLFAAEVNREIVPCDEYDQCILEDGDSVEIVRAIGGG